MKNFFGDKDIFAKYRFHGNITWKATDLARMGLLFSWSEKKNVTDAFTETVKRSMQLDAQITHTTYQGFMGALTKLFAHFHSHADLATATENVEHRR